MQKAKVFFLLLFIPFVLSAQENADFLRSTGKIYTVVIVICILFLGIVLYLFRLDKKIKNLEEKYKHER